MAEYVVDYDSTNARVTINGPLEEIASLPLVLNFLRDNNGTQISATQLVVPTSLAGLSQRYQYIKRLFERYGATIAEAADLSSEFAAVRQLDEQFSEFTDSAKRIWEGDVAPADMALFLECLARRCPSRTFYKLQILAAYHLAFSQNACNFSVPGAGKTATVLAAYAFLNSLASDNPKFVNHLLVVGPLSSFRPWEQEFALTFSRQAVRRRVASSMGREDREWYLRDKEPGSLSVELTLTSYQTLSSGVHDFQAFLRAKGRRAMVVLDEAHNVKRTDGVWASAALQIAPLAASRVVLTGTPAPNGYDDLQNLFKFIYPDRNVIGFPGSALKAMTLARLPKALPELKHKIRPFFTRIRKRDLGLPPIHQEVVNVSMDVEQSSIYQAIERKIVPGFSSKGARDSASPLVNAKLMRLRQAATNPSLLLRPLKDEIEGGSYAEAYDPTDPGLVARIRSFEARHSLAKLRVLKTMLDDLLRRESKILIWSIFLGNLALLASELRDVVPQLDVLSGQTPVEGDDTLPEDFEIETRERIIDRFLNSKQPSILLANPQAVGESISLHSACHVAIYFDRDFNAGRFIQSKDRIHRYGLAPDVQTNYYYLVTGNTIDEDIHRRLEQKEARLQQLIDADDIPLFQLVLGADEDAADLRAVIESYERRKTA